MHLFSLDTHAPSLVLAAVLGAIVGSFCNVLISRLPRALGFVADEGKPSGIALPPSQCEACGRKLSPGELVPLLSFVLLRGRCRTCGASIGYRHLVVEVLGALSALIAVGAFGVGVEALASFALFQALTVLAFIDIETGYLPDAITLPLIGGGLLNGLLLDEHSWRLSLAGTLIAGGSFLLLRMVYSKLRNREGLGGGDVKLFAAGGAWCGPFALPAIVLIASLGGLAVVATGALLKAKPISGAQELRFGPYLAAGIALGFLFVAPAYPN